MSNNPRLDSLNEATATPVTLSAGLDLHPDMLAPHGQVLVDDLGGSGETVYSAGRTSLKIIYEAISAIDAAHQAQLEPVAPIVKGAPVRKEIPHSRRAALADAMSAKFVSTSTAAERADEAVDEAIAQIETRIALATSNPRKDAVSVAQAASEIRQHVKSMKSSSERMEFVRKAIEDGDLEIASAVLQTSCYSSGFGKQEFDVIRGMTQAKFAPRDFAQRTSALAVKAALSKAQGLFLQRYAALLPRVSASPADDALANLKKGG